MHAEHPAGVYRFLHSARGRISALRAATTRTGIVLLLGLASLLVAAFSGPAYSDLTAPLELLRSGSPASLDGHVDVWYEDGASAHSGELPPAGAEWRRLDQALEVGGTGAVWLRFHLSESESGNEWLIALPTTSLEDALFVGPFDAAGVAQAAPIRSGLNQAYSSRPLQNERLVFPFRLPQPGDYTVLLRLDSSIRVSVAPQIWHTADYLVSRKHKTLFDGICYGILITLLVYNIALTGAFRSRAYLYYVLTCASALLTLSTYNGHAAHYLWPETPWLIRSSYTLAPGLWLFFSALFARAFLATKDLMPRADSVIRGFVAAALAAIAAALAGYGEVAQTLTEVLVVVGSLAIAIVAALLWYRGSRIAIWYLVAQSMVFSAAILVVLINWGLLDAPFLLANALQIGVSAEMIVFAAALSARINRVQSEKAELDTRAAHLAVAASTDPLTGVANRSGLAQAAEQTLQSENEQVLLLIDLNGFKAVNDENGHEAGDMVLIETARRLQRHLRGADIITRTGGDEFVILLTDHPERHRLDRLLQRLSDALAQPIEYRGRRLSISASFGAARYPQDGDTLQALQRVADRAMYRAKQSGVCFVYSPVEALATQGRDQ